MWLVAALLGLAWAQEGPAQPGPGGTESPTPPGAQLGGAFHDDLAAAKQALYEGRNKDSMAGLERLRNRLDRGESPPVSIAREALVYLGDVQYLEGQQVEARETFRRVLLDAPNYEISPYHHTEDVRAFFGLVRDAVKAEIALRPVPPEPKAYRPRALPVWGYMPFGIPQFKRGRSGAGVVFGGLQAGAVSASVALYVVTKRANTLEDDHPYNWSPEQVQRRVRDYRQFGQWPATTAFYGLWVASVVDASVEWRRHERQKVNVVFTPRGVVVGGEF